MKPLVPRFEEEELYPSHTEPKMTPEYELPLFFDPTAEFKVEPLAEGTFLLSQSRYNRKAFLRGFESWASLCMFLDRQSPLARTEKLYAELTNPTTPYTEPPTAKSAVPHEYGVGPDQAPSKPSSYEATDYDPSRDL